MSFGNALLAALMNSAGKQEPIDVEKERALLIKETKRAILDAAVNSMTMFQLQGLSQEEGLRIAHAALAHTLGYFEEAIKDKDTRAFAKEGENFEEKIAKARDHNHALGIRHFQFHKSNIDSGTRERCTDDHFVEKSDPAK